MRIVIPSHVIKAGKVGGAEQLLYSLVLGLLELGTEVQLLASSKLNLEPAFLRAAELFRSFDLREVGTKGPRFLSEAAACWDQAAHGDVILFPNYFTPPVVPKRCGRVITLLLDLQYRHLPQYFSRKKRTWLALAHRATLSRAERVITISEYVRQDMIRVYGEIAERKCRAIHVPVSWDRFQGSEGSPSPIQGDYVLSVANHYPHKNLDTLIRGFALLRYKRPDLRLVLVGQLKKSLVGSQGGKDPQALIEELGLQQLVKVTGYVDDIQVGIYFRNARLFAFPSIFEGFGIPPVEAMGLGIPTLTTRRTSLEEVTLGKAQYVEDPFSAQEWAKRMEEMLAGPQRLPSELTAEIREAYSLRKIAKQYLEVFQS